MVVICGKICGKIENCYRVLKILPVFLLGT